MTKHPSALALVFAFAFPLAIATPAGAAEERARRACPPDAGAARRNHVGIGGGRGSVLDPEARYIDESGKVLTKKQMVGDIKPLPEGVSDRSR